MLLFSNIIIIVFQQIWVEKYENFVLAKWQNIFKEFCPYPELYN